MRHRLGRVRVVTAFFALSASWPAGWAVACHLATDEHHGHDAPDQPGVLGLEVALHGHLHSEGTPAHDHPVVGSVAAPVPARLSLLAPAMIGDAPEDVLTNAPRGRRLPSQAGPNHDPPPREFVLVLRI